MIPTTVALALALLIPSIQSTDLQLTYQNDVIQPPIRVGCVLGNCFGQLFHCLVDRTCSRMLRCLSACSLALDQTGENNLERCQIKCVLTPPEHSPPVTKFLSCLSQHSCIRPVPDGGDDGQNDSCPLPRYQHRNFRYPNDLLGKWWVLRGHSPVYDCWPCQTMTFSHMYTRILDEPIDMLRYDYTTMIDKRKRLVRHIPCTVQRHNSTEPDGHLMTRYTVADLFSGTDDWHVMDVSADGRFMLIYYCGMGELSSGRYQGAVVMTRDTTDERKITVLPTEMIARFNRALRLGGIQLDVGKFCVNDLSNCHHN